jgi:hypothetical protein
MILASQVQIAVDLADCADAQEVFDAVCPGNFDVLSPERTLWAEDNAPTVPAFAVGQGKVEQADYAAMAALALSAGIHHLAIGQWEQAYPGGPQTLLSAGEGGTLWEALGLVPVADPEEEEV